MNKESNCFTSLSSLFFILYIFQIVFHVGVTVYFLFLNNVHIYLFTYTQLTFYIIRYLTDS